ncbi:MAG: hypothetical protein RBT67_06120 [Thauera sp.]|jgi:hypothetical protein|nr:hypothetical protein [Thauera sp.]
MNQLNHCFSFFEHLQVVEPQHHQVLLREVCIPLLVPGPMRGLEMLTAVQFDHEACGGAVEIDDVRADRLLAIELEAMELLAAQAMPELLFGIGLVAAEFAGEGFLGGWVGFHLGFLQKANPPWPPFCKGGKFIAYRRLEVEMLRGA